MVDAPDMFDRNGKINFICMFRYGINDYPDYPRI